MVESGECGTIYIHFDITAYPYVMWITSMRLLTPMPQYPTASASCYIRRSRRSHVSYHSWVEQRYTHPNADSEALREFRTFSPQPSIFLPAVGVHGITPHSQPTCTRRYTHQATVAGSRRHSRAGQVLTCASVLCPYAAAITVQWSGIYETSYRVW